MKPSLPLRVITQVSVQRTDANLGHQAGGSSDYYMPFAPAQYAWNGQGCITNPPYPITLNPQGTGVVNPKLTSISPTKGLIGTTISGVTLTGSGFGTAATVNAGTGITVTYTSRSNTSIKANFAIASNATAGNHAVTVTAGGQTSGSVNFYVQVPTSLSVVSQSVVPITYIDPSCTSYGIAGALKYQVLDQGQSVITSSNMEPQEEALNFVVNGVNKGNPVPSWADVGPSNYPGTAKFTGTNGQYLDAPLGFCANVAFTATMTQPISILLNGTNYTVRTSNWTMMSTTVGHGTLKNGSDISLSY